MSWTNRIRQAGEGFMKFIRECRSELRKVQWPSRKEATVYTVVVIASVIVIGAAVWAMDSVFSNILKVIL